MLCYKSIFFDHKVLTDFYKAELLFSGYFVQ
jgi:hypothetical protein